MKNQEPATTNQQAIAIYTIGYGARTIEDLISLLEHYQIAFLLDVRTSPYSKYKPKFSKQPLAAALQEQGIRYLFMGDTLGGQPKDDRCYTDGKVDYDKVKAISFYQQGIARLQAAFNQRQRVALMCSEGKPEMCHRSKLIGATLTEMAIPVVHIDENDTLQDQEAIIQRLTGGQLMLFGGHSFQSRKRYGDKAKIEVEENTEVRDET